MKDCSDFEQMILKLLIELKEDVAGLKVKAGIWGALAGLASAGALLIGSMLK
jgi:hypothetical protein